MLAMSKKYAQADSQMIFGLASNLIPSIEVCHLLREIAFQV
jgi:hypothetical protein